MRDFDDDAIAKRRYRYLVRLLAGHPIADAFDETITMWICEECDGPEDDACEACGGGGLESIGWDRLLDLLENVLVAVLVPHGPSPERVRQLMPGPKGTR